MGDRRSSMVSAAFDFARRWAAQGSSTVTQQRYSVGYHGSNAAMDNIRVRDALAPSSTITFFMARNNAPADESLPFT